MAVLSSTKFGDHLKRGDYDGSISYAQQNFTALKNQVWSSRLMQCARESQI